MITKSPSSIAIIDAGDTEDENARVEPIHHSIRLALPKVTPKESTSAAITATLLEDIDRLNREVRELKRDERRYRELYHERDKAFAVQSVQAEDWRRNDFIYTVCISIGSALLGAIPSYTGPLANWSTVAAIILIVVALLFRFAKR